MVLQTHRSIKWFVTQHSRLWSLAMKTSIYDSLMSTQVRKECDGTGRGTSQHFVPSPVVPSFREGHSLHDCPHGCCDRTSYWSTWIMSAVWKWVSMHHIMFVARPYIVCHLLQVTMAHLGSGTRRAGSVCRKSQPTGSAMTSPYSMLHRICQSRFLLVLVQTVLQRSLPNSSVPTHPARAYIGTCAINRDLTLFHSTSFILNSVPLICHSS